MFKLPAAKKHSTSLIVFVMVLCLAGALFASATAAEEDQINHLIGEKVMAVAATGALLLDGEMGDFHQQIVADGHRDSQAYADFVAILQQIRDANQATYVYTLIKTSDEMTNLIVDAAEGEEADPFGTEYEMEPQFKTAFAGTPDYAEHTWDDDTYGTQKSAFAPIHNSQGEIVAILGVDYPIDELLECDLNLLVGEKAMAVAATGALLLDGEMGDFHQQIVADGHRDSQAYADIVDILQQIRDVNRATYVYTLIKVSDDMTNLIVDAAEGEEADPFGTEYEMEPQFKTAFAGTPDYAEHTWDDDTYGTQKSAFAPIHNSQGEIVAILGVDYPAPELAAAEAEQDEEQTEVAGPAAGTFISILVIIAVIIGASILVYKRKQAAA